MAMNSKSSDLSILRIDLHDLAKQICLKDMELFKAITIEEINSFYWTKKNKKNRCPNLTNSNQQFNKINLWVQGEILDQAKTQKEIIDHVHKQNEIMDHTNKQNEIIDHASTQRGVKVLSKFIKLSKNLLFYNNFQSAYAVKAALESTPIYRLEQLWSGVSKKHNAMWEKVCNVFSLEDNYHNLRSTIAARKPPLIPFLGVYLSDLTGLDAAHPKIDGLETDIRKSSMAKMYDSIKHYQAFRYDFKEHRGIQDFIKSMNYMEEFESIMLDSYFFMSKNLEPNSSLTGSCSSQASSLDMPSKQGGQITDNSPIHKRRSSPNLTHRGSYRLISEDERKTQMIILPDSPTLTNERHSKTFSNYGNRSTLTNIIDDSEVPPQNGTNTDSHKNALHHTKSMQHQSSTSPTLFRLSPAINLTGHFNSFRKSDIETKSYVQYNDPDILTTNHNLMPVLTGLVRRKIKSNSSICLSGYQKVLARLFLDQLECFINFYTAKTTRAKCEDDFRDEYHAKISLIDAELKFDPLKCNPKIYINLPHQHYVIQSIEDTHSCWPTIDKWWPLINESIDKVKASKAAVFQPQHNLINFEDDFTRL